MAAKREDGCEAVKDAVGNLAKKLGGELFRNKDGVYVIKMHGTETMLPTAAAVTEHLPGRAAECGGASACRSQNSDAIGCGAIGRLY